MKLCLLAFLLIWIPSPSLAQSGVCYVDGVAHTTLAQGITCAGSAGTIEVTPSVGVLSVPSSATVPAGVTLRIDQGATLLIASGQTLTISGPLVDGPYRMFAGPGSVLFTLPGNQAVSRPEWFGAVADGTTGPGTVTGTDNLAAFNLALVALPNMVYFDQGTQTLQNGSLARTGKLLLSPGRYVVSDTLNWSPWVSYECPSYNTCTIYLKDGVATSGAEKWVINLQAVGSGVPSPNTTYGAQLHNITVDCQGGKYYGSNAASSGVTINGAQGTSLGNIWILNCGKRGLWIANNAGNVSSVNGENIIEVVGVVIGPGVQIDAGACNIEIIRSEDVNSAGASKDADGDPNPAILIGSASSNGSFNLNINMLGSEKSFLPVKIWGGSAVSIQNIAVAAPAPNGAPTAVEISHGGKSISIGPMFTYAASPLFTNFIIDLTTTPTTVVSGNFAPYPSIQGYKTRK
jgi:hypothetical protein